MLYFRSLHRDLVSFLVFLILCMIEGNLILVVLTMCPSSFRRPTVGFIVRSVLPWHSRPCHTRAGDADQDDVLTVLYPILKGLDSKQGIEAQRRYRQQRAAAIGPGEDARRRRDADPRCSRQNIERDWCPPHVQTRSTISHLSRQRTHRRVRTQCVNYKDTINLFTPLHPLSTPLTRSHLGKPQHGKTVGKTAALT